MTITYFVLLDGKPICRQSFEMRDGATTQEIEIELEKQMERFDVEYIDPLYEERNC